MEKSELQLAQWLWRNIMVPENSEFWIFENPICDMKGLIVGNNQPRMISCKCYGRHAASIRTKIQDLVVEIWHKRWNPTTWLLKCHVNRPKFLVTHSQNDVDSTISLLRRRERKKNRKKRLKIGWEIGQYRRAAAPQAPWSTTSLYQKSEIRSYCHGYNKKSAPYIDLQGYYLPIKTIGADDC